VLESWVGRRLRHQKGPRSLAGMPGVGGTGEQLLDQPRSSVRLVGQRPRGFLPRTRRRRSDPYDANRSVHDECLRWANRVIAG
jgi:hypothetical protein